MAEKVAFIRKIAKMGDRLVIIIPRELHDKVNRDKYYKITLEELKL